MASSDVHLIQMGDTSVASGDGDILKLDVHVVLRLEELATVDLAGGDLESNDMALFYYQPLFNCMMKQRDGLGFMARKW